MYVIAKSFVHTSNKSVLTGQYQFDLDFDYEGRRYDASLFSSEMSFVHSLQLHIARIEVIGIFVVFEQNIFH